MPKGGEEKQYDTESAEEEKDEGKKVPLEESEQKLTTNEDWDEPTQNNKKKRKLKKKQKRRELIAGKNAEKGPGEDQGEPAALARGAATARKQPNDHESTDNNGGARAPRKSSPENSDLSQQTNVLYAANQQPNFEEDLDQNLEAQHTEPQEAEGDFIVVGKKPKKQKQPEERPQKSYKGLAQNGGKPGSGNKPFKIKRYQSEGQPNNAPKYQQKGAPAVAKQSKPVADPQPSPAQQQKPVADS